MNAEFDVVIGEGSSTFTLLGTECPQPEEILHNGSCFALPLTRSINGQVFEKVVVYIQIDDIQKEKGLRFGGKDASMKLKEVMSLHQTSDVSLMRIVTCRDKATLKIHFFNKDCGFIDLIDLNRTNNYRINNTTGFGKLELTFNFSFAKPTQTKINIDDETANKKLSDILWAAATIQKKIKTKSTQTSDLAKQNQELQDMAMCSTPNPGADDIYKVLSADPLYGRHAYARPPRSNEETEAPSTIAPRQCCGNCTHSKEVFSLTSDTSKTVYCEEKQTNVPRVWPGNGCWAEADESKQEAGVTKEIKELSLTEFVKGCLPNYQLRAATKWGEGHGYYPEEDQDEICADLAEQNQQLQRRVDELEKCLAAQEEQISDYAKEFGPLRERDREARRILRAKYAATNSQFR